MSTRSTHPAILSAPRTSVRLRRVSASAPAYPAREDFSSLDEDRVREAKIVTPVFPAQGHVVRMERSFSAQLLELGLRHNMDALVNKAQGYAEGSGQAVRTPAQQYEHAQNSFATPHLLRWRV